MLTAILERSTGRRVTAESPPCTMTAPQRGMSGAWDAQGDNLSPDWSKRHSSHTAMLLHIRQALTLVLMVLLGLTAMWTAMRLLKYFAGQGCTDVLMLPNRSTMLTSVLVLAISSQGCQQVC